MPENLTKLHINKYLLKCFYIYMNHFAGTALFIVFLNFLKMNQAIFTVQ